MPWMLNQLLSNHLGLSTRFEKVLRSIVVIGNRTTSIFIVTYSGFNMQLHINSSIMEA